MFFVLLSSDLFAVVPHHGCSCAMNLLSPLRAAAGRMQQSWLWFAPGSLYVNGGPMYYSASLSRFPGL